MPSINFTKEQYLELLKAVHAHAMMLESLHEVEGKPLTGEEYKLNDYLLSFAESFGLSRVNLEYGRRDWSDDLFEESYEVMNDYGEKEMWENLAWHLAELKYEREYANNSNRIISSEERFEKLWELNDKFLDEFAEHGLKRIKFGA